MKHGQIKIRYKDAVGHIHKLEGEVYELDAELVHAWVKKLFDQFPIQVEAYLKVNGKKGVDYDA